MFRKIFFALTLFAQLTLLSQQIETFYGPIEVEEPLILELLNSPAVQRLKAVHQYGDSYYTTHREEYSRYDHSVGVFAILRLKGASFEEQIAGLLHDASHTVFSHVGDFLFNFESQKDAYQDSVHEWFLKRYGVGEILERHGLTISQIHHKHGGFQALEQELPNLCADRIDYNIQGAYLRGMITKEEALEIVEDLEFSEGRWISTKPALMRKVALFSLLMTHSCWGSARSYLTSLWLADALNRALAEKILSSEEISFGTDDQVWEKLQNAEDPHIQKMMAQIATAESHFTLVERGEADLHVKRKFRGVDPWIRMGDRLVRLTAIDEEIRLEYERVKTVMREGWQIKYVR
ncbi:MAG: hypothetical protein HYX48_07795 [Chlamydiales bacterium]|nr:hypothetical protein [Chlamydiales bacterium]